MADDAPRIARNVAEVRQRIAAALQRSGRGGQAVTLVAVTKYVDTDLLPQLIAAECWDLGESRPQELWRKAAALPDPRLRWHQIGPLQRNKARHTVELAHLIHSVNSVKLLETLDRAAAELGRRTAVLLEVNISGEPEKQGFLPMELDSVVPALMQLGHVEVHGLMTMASRGGDLDLARREFAGLRELRDRLRALCPAPHTLEELSMGMSGDYEVALAEGATIIRIGSALFS